MNRTQRQNDPNDYNFSRNRRTGRRTLDFNAFASEGNRFVNEVADELATDRNSAARILRAVLHAVRDRIPPDDAIEFAQGLPMALKGLYIDQYDPSVTPVVIRNVDEFLDFIYWKDGISASFDFTSRDSIIYALQAVFRVLSRNMDRGQVEQIKHMLNIEIRNLIEY